MVRVLLVEDDAAMRLLTKTKLKTEYEILEAADGMKALETLDHNHVDLMIVDIMMPNMNGYEFVESLRESGDLTPVILLTAMDSFEHKKKGFERGIDDYLTKPVDYEELKWRMEAILRRAKIMHENQITTGGLVLSEKTMAASYEGRTIELTEKEFELLYKLLSYPGILFTKQQLMDEIWGYDTETEYDTIKTYISRLRKKFEDCSAFELVSVRGLGYKAEIR
ncbi:MAG: response regulator transcription factor [Lachnospiraceae bacterium]|nr:response regulator transcription factor [Lachnospiraceae bacterium]